MGLSRGVDLPDPEGLLEGTGKKIRHVKIMSAADAKKKAVKALRGQAGLRGIKGPISGTKHIGSCD